MIRELKKVKVVEMAEVGKGCAVKTVNGKTIPNVFSVRMVPVKLVTLVQLNCWESVPVPRECGRVVEDNGRVVKMTYFHVQKSVMMASIMTVMVRLMLMMKHALQVLGKPVWETVVLRD